MHYIKPIINCNAIYANSRIQNGFKIVKAVFNPQDQGDLPILRELMKKATTLATDVNQNAANNSRVARNYNVRLAHCFAGVLSKYCWNDYINLQSQTGSIVEIPQANSSVNQIDLKVIGNNKSIEVRSSFPRNGIEFAICNPTYEFDIIGPYNNDYKPGEIAKDFYLRSLFHYNTPTDILSFEDKETFEVYLTGRATWGMMNNSQIYITKALIPEGSLSNVSSNYRVIPYHRALDTKDIVEYIINS